MRYRLLLCLMMLLSVFVRPASAQTQDDLLRQYRNEWRGYVIEAEVFKHYGVIEATPDWWTFLGADRENGYPIVHVSRGLLDIAPSLGWANVLELDEKMGGNGDAPPVLAALASWKGNVQVRIKLPAGIPDEQKKQFCTNFDLLSGVVGWKNTCQPRGKKLFINVTADPKATEVTGKVSADGNTYDIAIPVYASVTSGQFEEVFKKGMP